MECFHILHITSVSTPKHSSNGDDLYHCAAELSLQVSETPFTLCDTWTLCLLGIPLELSIKDLTSFFEPYESEIYDMQILYSKSLHGYKCAILSFVDKLGLVAFSSLYNNLHYPSTSGLVAPCVAFAAFVTRDATATTSHTAFPLPECIFCIAKLHIRLSHVDLPLLQEYYTHTENRCLVCDIYNNSNHKSRVCCTCGLHENLWTCLLCGHTGCGRYTSQHAQLHYQASGHPYSLELATGRIWDYARDTFVHADLPVLSDNTVDEPTLSKISNMQSEYESLLLIQLEDQRLYYEKVQQNMRSIFNSVKLLARETVRLLESGQNSEMVIESKDESTPSAHLLETIKMDISMQEYAYAQLLDEIRSAEQRTAELRKQNNKLLKEQKDMRTKCAELTKRKEDLRNSRLKKSEQLQQEITDLEFYVRTQQQVEASPLKDEVRNGVMIVAEDSNSSIRKDKHKRRGQRR